MRVLTTFRVLTKTVTLLTPNLYKIDLVLSPIETHDAATCAAAVAAPETGDSGAMSTDPHSWSSVPSPAGYPAVVIVGGGYVNSGTAIGDPPVTVAAPFTLLQSYASADYDHTNCAVGYRALASGAPGTFTADWAGNGAAGWRAVSLAIPTAATAPVQSAQQDISGSTCTLPTPPTPGNLLVCVRVCETASPIGVAGWTVVESGTYGDGGVGPNDVRIAVRCAEEGDGTVIGTGDHSYSHWAFLSEWELT